MKQFLSRMKNKKEDFSQSHVETNSYTVTLFALPLELICLSSAKTYVSPKEGMKRFRYVGTRCITPIRIGNEASTYGAGFRSSTRCIRVDVRGIARTPRI